MVELPLIPDDLRAALQVLDDEGVEEQLVYIIRENEGQGWHGPRMNAFSDAWDTIKKYMENQPMPTPPPEDNNPWLDPGE